MENIFYNKINNIIKLAEIYMEIKNLSNIIKICRLKPYQLLNDKNVCKHWVDEFRNSMFIKKGVVNIVYNDLTIEENECTDLYYGLSMNEMHKISDGVYKSKGKGFEVNGWMGKDKRLRVFINEERVSPLYLGFNNLEIIWENWGKMGEIEKKFWYIFGKNESARVDSI
jgi:hypothetical protein